MWNRLRLYLVVGLSLCLAGVSNSAVAHIGMRDVQGQFVICTGQGVITMYVDANGDPVEPTSAAQVCPDCLLLSWDLSFASEAGVPLSLPKQTQLYVALEQSIVLTLDGFALARAPPMGM